VEAAGGAVRAVRPRSVDYTPGSEIRASYRATVEYRRSAREEIIVALARQGDPPRRSIPSEAGGMPIGVWRFPDDPSLPGLKYAMDHAYVDALLAELGLAAPEFELDLRSYSPRSRAVVAVTVQKRSRLVFTPGVGLRQPGPEAILYLKVRRPERAAQIYRAHELVAERVTTPECLGWKEDLGILVLAPLAGATLWSCLHDGTYPAPSPEALLNLLDAFADIDLPASNRDTTSTTVPRNAAILRAIAPDRAAAIDRLVDAFGEDSPQPEVTIHGDFHEEQILVDRSGITGILDLDDAGRGQRVDDLAMMAGRLRCFAETEPDRAGRVVAYTEQMIEVFTQNSDPRDFRRRLAGVALNHATGPFRSQSSRWERETREAIDFACSLSGNLVS
jgi:aminoglycoside phosphotransferase (APT) family kinase protein